MWLRRGGPGLSQQGGGAGQGGGASTGGEE